MHVMPAVMYDTINAGPATDRAAAPVATKMPAPITAPMPRLVSVMGPSTRRRRCSPAISSSRTFRLFFANSWLGMRVLRSIPPLHGTTSRRPEERRLNRFAFHQQSHRAVVDQFHLHHGAEAASFGLDALGLEGVDEFLVRRDGRGGRGGVDEARPPAPVAIAIEGELAHHQGAAARLDQVAVHLAVGIVEDAQRRDLVCQP